MYTALVRTGYTTSINLFFWILYISDISDPFIFPQTLNIQTDGGKKSLTFIPLAPACVVSTNISLSTNLSLSLSLSPFSFCILCYLSTDSDSPRIPKEEFSHEQRYWSQKYALCRRKWCLQMAIHSPELADLKRLFIDHVFYRLKLKLKFCCLPGHSGVDSCICCSSTLQSPPMEGLWDSPLICNDLCHACKPQDDDRLGPKKTCHLVCK